MIIDLLKAYLSHKTITEVYKSFTYNMAAKTSWHRYNTNLCHCHPMYRVHLMLRIGNESVPKNIINNPINLFF